MKLLLSCITALGLSSASLLAAGNGDLPRTLHHARIAPTHLVAPRQLASRAAHRGSRVNQTRLQAKPQAQSQARPQANSRVQSPALAANPKSVGTSRRRSAGRARLQRARLSIAPRRGYERFRADTIVTEQGVGDNTIGEDPTIRAALIDALGNMHGTALVINPANGRILAMVNQKIALSPGAEPCSTIKLSVAMAALSEGLVTRDTPVQLGQGRDAFRMNMTQALAHSNNLYFEEMGRELGFDRVRHYATQFGLGELAGYNIPGEQLGIYPAHEIPASEGGVARMCSFGQGVSLTPLQLGAYVAAIANGGTLYYLQHPASTEEVAAYEPRVKRTLEISRFIPEMQEGMAGAVEYGTARSLRVNFRELPVFGKTGTCSENGTHLGWFASYAQSPQGNLVTVFFLEGGRTVFGPHAAELTGVFYRSLWDHKYFTGKPESPAAADPVQASLPVAHTSSQVSIGQ